MALKKLLACAAVVGLGLSLPPVSHAELTGTVDGAYFYGGTNMELQGTQICTAPNVCQRIPTSVSPGNEAADAVVIENWLASNPGATRVVGHSYGSETLYAVERYYAANGGAPTGVQFITYGNPERKYNGWLVLNSGNNGCNCGSGLPENPPVPVIDVAVQYDGWADWPNNPSSPYYGLAVINAVIGMFTTHMTGYMGIDPLSPTNLIYQEGNVTYVFVPSDKLPILFGGTNAGLQTNIETAYSRPAYADPPATTLSAPQTTLASTQTTQATTAATTQLAAPTATKHTSTKPHKTTLATQVKQVSVAGSTSHVTAPVNKPERGSVTGQVEKTKQVDKTTKPKGKHES